MEANDRVEEAEAAHRRLLDEITLRFVKQVGSYALSGHEENELLAAGEREAEARWQAKEGQLLLACEAMQKEHLTYASELKEQFEQLLVEQEQGNQASRARMKTAHHEAIRQITRNSQEEAMQRESSAGEYEAECLVRYQELVQGLKEMNQTEEMEVLAGDMEEFSSAFELQHERGRLELEARA